MSYIRRKGDQTFPKSLNSLAGSLKKYAKKNETIEKIMKEKRKALEERIVEKYKRAVRIKDKK
ncbi:hypothetical protein [Persephonella sp.]